MNILKIAIPLFLTTMIIWGFQSKYQPTNTQAVKDSTAKIKIEIWSDIVCPFCYIGKKKLEKAIATLGAEDKVEIIWHSFQLDPSFPVNEAHPSMEYLAQHKQIPMAQLQQMTQQLTAQAKAYDIDFKFDKALTFNTLNAHRLIQWAKTLDKATLCKEALIKAYFTDGKNLSEENILLDVIASVGLDKAAAKKVLNSDLYKNEVLADIQAAEKLGINGVPFFTINGNAAISGAQDDRIFEQKLAAALATAKP